VAAYGSLDYTGGRVVAPTEDLLKFMKDRCPAAHYGVQCSGKATCGIPEQVRIPLEEARQIFSPVARDSYKWEKLYAMRNAVKRAREKREEQMRQFCRNASPPGKPKTEKSIEKEAPNGRGMTRYGLRSTV